LSGSASGGAVVALDGGQVDLATGILRRGGQLVELTPIESALLRALAATPDTPHSPADLLQSVWGYVSGVRSRTVYATINRLRAKIELDPSQPTAIVTLPGRGYCFRRASRARSGTAGRFFQSGRAFVGREADLARLDTWLRSDSRLLTVLGPGGVGKTRLAAEFVAALDSSWSSSLWCDLVHARDSGGVERAVARELGSQSSAGVGRALARSGAVLLVLDNLEQVAEGVATVVARWLSEAPRLKLLATSRTPLRLGQEVLLELEPLSEQSGIELLTQRTDAYDEGWSAVAESETLRALVERLDGLPLAIELAASRARVFDSEQLLERLADRFRILTSARADVPHRHRTLEAAIRWSWELLQPAERDALAQLCVFAGGFTVEAAEAVVSLEAHDATLWIPDVLASLRDHSLLHKHAGNGGRLRLLESVREFASARLVESGRWDATTRRHASYFAAFGTPLRLRGLAGPLGGVVRRSLRREIDNILLAFDVSERADSSEQAAFAALAGLELLLARGPFESAMELGTRAAALSGLAPSVQVRVLRSVGRAAELSGHSNEALSFLQRALPVARSAGLETEEGLLSLNLGVLERASGRLDRAQTFMNDALACFRQADDRARTGIALTCLGNLQVEQGNLQVAEALYLEARGCQVLARNRRGEGTAEADLAGVARLRGDIEGARRHYDRGRAIFSEVGDRLSDAVLVGNHGEFLLQSGDVEGAAFRLEEAVMLLGEMDFAGALGAFNGALADVRVAQGRDDEATALLEEGEALLRGVGDRTELGKLLCRKGALAATRGDVRAGHAALGEAEALCADQGLGPGSLLSLLCAELRGLLSRSDVAL